MREPTMHQIFTELATGLHGGFARKLAEAWFLADEDNRKLIETTWPRLIIKARYFIETAPQAVD